jgi:hypothetical protein
VAPPECTRVRRIPAQIEEAKRVEWLMESKRKQPKREQGKRKLPVGQPRDADGKWRRSLMMRLLCVKIVVACDVDVALFC